MKQGGCQVCLKCGQENCCWKESSVQLKFEVGQTWKARDGLNVWIIVAFAPDNRLIVARTGHPDSLSYRQSDGAVGRGFNAQSPNDLVSLVVPKKKKRVWWWRNKSGYEWIGDNYTNGHYKECGYTLIATYELTEGEGLGTETKR
jgi:hypothetical protein